MAGLKFPRASGKHKEDDSYQSGCKDPLLTQMNHLRIIKNENEQLKTDDDRNHPPYDKRAKITITQRDCVGQHHLKTQIKQKWIGQQIEGQETDRDKNREALISVGDKIKSSTYNPIKKQIHIQKLLQICGDHCKEDTTNWEIVNCTKLRDEARHHVGHRRRIIRNRPTTIHMKEGVIPKALRRSHTQKDRPQCTGSSHIHLQVQVIVICSTRDTAYNFGRLSLWLPSKLAVWARLEEQYMVGSEEPVHGHYHHRVGHKPAQVEDLGQHYVQTVHKTSTKCGFR